MAASKIRTLDNKLPIYLRILEEVGKLASKPYVKIGYPAEAETTNNPKKIKIGDGETIGHQSLTVLAVAVFMEFGTITVPERSYIRSSYDDNFYEMLEFTKELVGKIYDGKMTVERALDLIGLKMVNNAKNKIRMRIPPVLAVNTILRKGSDVPLIDTSQLLNAITFKRIMG